VPNERLADLGFFFDILRTLETIKASAREEAAE
jgi:hypothetical protein